MSRFYTVKEAAKELLKSTSKEVSSAPEKDSDAPRRPEWTAWGNKITLAVLDGKLIGVSGSSAIDPNVSGAAVAAVLCKIRADDLNTWLESIRCEYRFDEKPETQSVAEQESNQEQKKDSGKDNENTIILREAQIIGEEIYKNTPSNATNRGIAIQLVTHLQTDYKIYKAQGTIRNILTAANFKFKIPQSGGNKT